MKSLLLAFLLALSAWVPPAQAQSEQNTGVRCDSLTVSSSSAAIPIVGGIRTYLAVGVATNGPVCFFECDRGTDCTSAYTDTNKLEPRCLDAEEGWEWEVNTDRWTGAVWAMLKSGSTAAVVGYCAY